VQILTSNIPTPLKIRSFLRGQAPVVYVD